MSKFLTANIVVLGIAILMSLGGFGVGNGVLDFAQIHTNVSDPTQINNTQLGGLSTIASVDGDSPKLDLITTLIVLVLAGVGLGISAGLLSGGSFEWVSLGIAFPFIAYSMVQIYISILNVSASMTGFAQAITLILASLLAIFYVFSGIEWVFGR